MKCLEPAKCNGAGAAAGGRGRGRFWFRDSRQQCVSTPAYAGEFYPPEERLKADFIVMVFAGRTVHCTHFDLRDLTRFRVLASEHEAFANAFASFGVFP